MDLSPDKQAQVDALYLLVTGRGYVPSEVIVAMLAEMASPGVRAALALLEDHNARAEAEREQRAAGMVPLDIS